MNIWLLVLTMILGIFGSWCEIYHVKHSYFVKYAYIVSFFLTCLSSLWGNLSETDLGAYLSYFLNHNDAYFGTGYVYLTNILHFFIGESSAGYIISIIFIQILITYFCAVNLDLSKKYILTFFVLFNAYWGISFTIEIIRSGLAIAFSLMATLYALKKQAIKAFIFMLFSTSMHVTEFLFLPFLIWILVGQKRSKVVATNYILWALVLLVLDGLGFGYALYNFIRDKILDFFKLIGSSEHYLAYFDIDIPSPFEYISKQYVFYYFLGFTLIYLQKFSNGDARFLGGYFIGLSIHTVFSAFGATIRLQWMYLVLSVFIVYSFITNDSYSKFDRFLYLLLLTTAQCIMAILYLDSWW